MLKSLRVPEKLFEFAMWAVSLIFAFFLSQLGGKLVADLPGVDQSVTLESHIPADAQGAVEARRATIDASQKESRTQRENAQLRLTAAENASRVGQESFDAWIKTRTATSDPLQDPEVLRRTRSVEALKLAEREAQKGVEAIDAQLQAASQSADSLSTVEGGFREVARPAYERELFQKELAVFLMRLLMTGPLLVIAGWLIAKKRKSDYWPLARGFVIFALFAFFVHLAPYLPSYGGYIRYGVGVILTLVAGLYVIRAMRRYVAKRQVAEQQSDAERRRTLGYEEAIRKMNAGVCPGCERAIAGGIQSPSNFCVHCGLNLFDNCAACSIRKNAFFQYCPACGVTSAARNVSNTAPQGTPA